MLGMVSRVRWGESLGATILADDVGSYEQPRDGKSLLGAMNQSNAVTGSC